jgi:hypothetical protein
MYEMNRILNQEGFLYIPQNRDEHSTAKRSVIPRENG